jgi:hypothetical protein
MRHSAIVMARGRSSSACFACVEILTPNYSMYLGPTRVVGTKLCQRLVTVDWNVVTPSDGDPQVKGIVTSYDSFDGFLSDLRPDAVDD